MLFIFRPVRFYRPNAENVLRQTEGNKNILYEKKHRQTSNHLLDGMAEVNICMLTKSLAFVSEIVQSAPWYPDKGVLEQTDERPDCL